MRKETSPRKPKTLKTVALLRSDLRDDRFRHPRLFRPKRGFLFYTTEEALRRPTVAAHSLARISEHLLAKSRRIAQRKLRADALVRATRLFYRMQEIVGHVVAADLKFGARPTPVEAVKKMLRPEMAALRELLPLVSKRYGA